MLIEYGKLSAGAEWRIEENAATGYSRIYYVDRGELYYVDNTGSHAMVSGKLYVLPSAGPYRITGKSPYTFSCTYMHISFDDARVISLIELTPADDPCLLNYLLSLRESMNRSRIQVMESLADIFSVFLRGHHSFVPFSKMQNTVQQYVREHIAEEISIEDLSRMLSYHPNYFIRLFRDETGYTPHQFLFQQRMQYAVVLLNKGFSNKEACEACGYTDSSTFTRAFRQYYGITPQKYKNGFRRP